MYFITGLSHINDLVSIDNPYYEEKCFGYFQDLLEAKKTILFNKNELHENTFKYLVVEKIKEGINKQSKVVTWYKWCKNKEIWHEIDEPEGVKGFTNFAIG